MQCLLVSPYFYGLSEEEISKLSKHITFQERNLKTQVNVLLQHKNFLPAKLHSPQPIVALQGHLPPPFRSLMFLPVSSLAILSIFLSLLTGNTDGVRQLKKPKQNTTHTPQKNHRKLILKRYQVFISLSHFV